MYSLIKNEARSETLSQFLKNPGKNQQRLYKTSFTFLAKPDFHAAVSGASVEQIKPVEEGLTETEQAFADAGVEALVKQSLKKLQAAGRLTPEITKSVMIQAVGLKSTIAGISAPSMPRKIILLGYDNELDPASNAAARAAEEAVNRYMDGALVEVRDSGAKLAERMQTEAAKLAKQHGVDIKDIFIATITNQGTLKRLDGAERSNLGKVLDIDNVITESGRRPIPIIGLYDFILRIAYGQDIEKDILPCLNRIAYKGPGEPFTRDDIMQLLNSGLLRLIPKARPVDMSEMAEINRAAKAVAQAL